MSEPIQAAEGFLNDLLKLDVSAARNRLHPRVHLRYNPGGPSATPTLQQSRPTECDNSRAGTRATSYTTEPGNSRAVLAHIYDCSFTKA
jgi:hypothetical protein